MQVLSGAALVALAFLAGSFQQIFEQMEMKELPLPTEAFLALSAFLRRPVGLIGFCLLELALIALMLRGSLDRVLRKWTVANAIFLTLLIPFYVLSVHLPIIKIQQTLGK
jgi:type II secretory pathway component PulF